MAEEEEEQPEAPVEEPPFYEPAKGSVANELELVFDDLYPDNSVNLARTQLAGHEPPEAPPLSPEAKRALQDVDVTAEKEAIKKGADALKAEEKRIDNVQEYLLAQKAQAHHEDLEIEDYLLSQGLTIKHQYPVGETMYNLDQDRIERDKLLDPHNAVIPVETEQAIAIGAKKKHPNYLLKAKPEAPTYYKNTASLAIRKEVRGITKVYTEEQRKELQNRHTTRPKRPRPKVLPASEREQNAQILRRMTIPTDFLRNPRYVPRDEGKCPFRITPREVTFEGYELGSVYEIKIEFLNCEGLGRRLRLVPFETSVFSVSTGLTYENKNVGRDASIAPGMKAYLSVWFSPHDLNDVSDVLYVQTEQGKFGIPLAARRFQPELQMDENPIQMGYVLAGGMLQKTITVKNVGGEGAFRFISPEVGEEDGLPPEAPPPQTAPTSQGSALTGTRTDTTLTGKTISGPYYDVSNPERITFVHGAFRISPASFYLEHDQICEITVLFQDNASVAIGTTNLPFLLEANNYTSMEGSIEVLVDTLRVELTGFAKELAPSLSRAAAAGGGAKDDHERTSSSIATKKLAIQDQADDGVIRPVRPSSPAKSKPFSHASEDVWSVAPWQLRFQIQLPAEESLSKYLVCSNGSHLPITVQWIFVEPPPPVAQAVAQGKLATLDQELLESMTTWTEIPTSDAPFRVSAETAVLPPFSQERFEFVYTPLQTKSVNKREVSHNCFAYLCVVESKREKACSSTSEQLSMQSSLQPEGYTPGLPLAANKWHERLSMAGLPSTEANPLAIDVSKEDYKLIAPTEPVRTSVCLMYAVNLMGAQTPPQVTMSPSVVTFANDPAPFLTHRSTVVLSNSGSQVMKYRVRTTARKRENARGSKGVRTDYHDALWIVGSGTDGARDTERPYLETSEGWEKLEKLAAWYDEQWPPLPPTLRADPYASKPTEDGELFPLHHSNLATDAEHLSPRSKSKSSFSKDPSGGANTATFAGQHGSDAPNFEGTARSEARDLLAYPDDPIRKSPDMELDELGKSMTQFDKEEDLRKSGDYEKYMQETHKSLKDLLTAEERAEIVFSSHDAAVETKREFKLQKEKDLEPFRTQSLEDTTSSSVLAATTLPDEGFGALAVLGITPGDGEIPAKGKVDLQLFFRAAVECDLDALVEIEIGDAVFPFRVIAPVRAPKPVFRNCAVLDFGIVLAKETHNLKMEIFNPTDLPTVVKLRTCDRATSQQFCVASAFRPNAMVQRGNELSLEEYERDKSDFYSVWSSFAAVVKEFQNAVAGKTLFSEGGQDSWEHSLVSTSNPQTDKVSFFPQFLLLPPNGKRDVFVTLRARNEESVDELAKVLTYGAPTSSNQWIQVLASVQRPRVVSSKSHFHFAITYTGEISDEVFTLRLKNTAGVVAPLKWRLPGADQPLEVSLTPKSVSASGVETMSKLDQIGPESFIEMEVRVTPRVALAARQSKETRVDVMVEVAGQPLPLRITVTAVVFGLEVDYLVQSPLEEKWPEIPYLRLPRAMLTEKQIRATACHPVYKDLDLPQVTGFMQVGRSGTGMFTRSQSRSGALTRGSTSAVSFTSAASSSRRTGASLRSGRGSQRSQGPTADTKALDFGSMPLLGKRHLRLLLYNRTGIPADWAAHMGKYKAYVAPPKEGQTSLQNRPASGKRKNSAEKFILDDKHETQVFSSAMGQEYAMEKLNKAAGSLNLKYGLGFAVALEPSSGRLEAFGMQVIDCYCYSDLPGTMTDHVHLRIGSLPEFLVDAKVVSSGNPLYLAPLQVGLNLNAEEQEKNSAAGKHPELSYGTLVLADRITKRRLRLGNLSSANIDVEWRYVKQQAIDLAAPARTFSELLLADQEGAGGTEDCGWSIAGLDPQRMQLPPIEPFNIAPEKGRVHKHSLADFDTTLKTDSVGKYHYKLMGIGKYAAKPGAAGHDGDHAHEEEAPPAASEPHLNLTSGGAVSSSMKMPSEKALVETLPQLELDHLNDSDSDADPAELIVLEPQPGDEPASPPKDKKKRKRARIAPADVAAAGTSGSASSSGPGKVVAGTSPSSSSRQLPPKLDDNKLASNVDNVVSTVIVECVGECVVPKLHLDRKTNPSYGEPIVKFFAQSMNPIPNLWTKNRVGPIAVGGGNLDPAPGIALGLIRKVVFTQDLPCFVHCRFRVPHGRFRILKLEQVGKQPILGAFLTKEQDSEDRFKVCLKHKEVVTLLVEFVPPKTWSKPTEKFEGALWIEYPIDQHTTTPAAATFHPPQVIRLEGTAKKPELQMDIVPIVETEPPLPIPSYYPPWGEPPLPVVEFSYLHVEANMPRKRQLILSNRSNVVAKWKLFHVKAPARSKEQYTVREREEQSLDDPTAFKFDIVEGTVCGPSQRSRLLPVGPALPVAWGHDDAELYEPQELLITFAPKLNRLYKCEFRLQVDNGNPVNFICTGTGSYDEEDDTMELIES
ncbi:unnamed protein product [Amoebophrya sp. A120]|nr:unnamed protein product [Amoebophrya sp. A120]|eukprot:GSA120T00002943001.1